MFRMLLWRARGDRRVSAVGWLGWAHRSQMLIAVSFTYVTFKIRVKIRERDQIPGSEFEDCVLAWLCNCCITCQMARHEGFDDDAK